MKVRITSLGCQRDEMLLFPLFQFQPSPQYFFPKENQTKIANKTKVPTGVQGPGSPRGSSKEQHPYSPMDLLVLFAGPAVARLGSAELLEFFFCKQKQLD